MDIKFYKILCVVFGLVMLLMLASAYSAEPAGATEVPPKCWEEAVPEEPTCEELQNCEPEEPPVVVDRDDDEDNQKCEAPGKVQGFRYQFVGASNRLRWEPKGSVDKVDIAVYGMDKTTLLYNVRTDDDGEYFIPSHTTWHKIRAVGNCGLSSWSKMIN